MIGMVGGSDLEKQREQLGNDVRFDDSSKLGELGNRRMLMSRAVLPFG